MLKRVWTGAVPHSQRQSVTTSKHPPYLPPAPRQPDVLLPPEVQFKPIPSAAGTKLLKGRKDISVQQPSHNCPSAATCSSWSTWSSRCFSASSSADRHPWPLLPAVLQLHPKTLNPTFSQPLAHPPVTTCTASTLVTSRVTPLTTFSISAPLLAPKLTSSSVLAPLLAPAPASSLSLGLHHPPAYVRILSAAVILTAAPTSQAVPPASSSALHFFLSTSDSLVSFSPTCPHKQNFY